MSETASAATAPGRGDSATAVEAHDDAGRVDALAQALLADPPVLGGVHADLAGVLPCEPVVGAVAVVCWRGAPGSDAHGEEHFELRMLDAGHRIDDDAALREALVLLAMHEALEDLVEPGLLNRLTEELAAWHERVEQTALHDPELAVRVGAAIEVLESALAVASEPSGVRIARVERLDAISQVLHQLETAWTNLELAAAEWADRRMAAAVTDDRHHRELWQVLQLARRGPLGRSPGDALREARDAARAMATAISRSRPDR